MKTNHRKVKSYVALLTAVACMATGTASLSASAVNSAVTGTNISQKQTQKLSETVYTFSDTEINLVLPNTAFANNLEKYSYSDTNVAGNTKSIGFSLVTTGDFKKYKAVVTNRLICNSVLGEMYNAGYSVVYAEPHGGTAVGSPLISIRIVKQNGNYSPQVTTVDASCIIPVDVSGITDSTATNEFYAITGEEGRELTGYFTTSTNCRIKMYKGKPVTVINGKSLLLDMFDLSGMPHAIGDRTFYKYVADSNGNVTSVTENDFNLAYASPKMKDMTLTQILPTTGTSYTVKGGYAIALPKGTYYNADFTMKSEYMDGETEGEVYSANHSPQIFDSSGYLIAGAVMSSIIDSKLNPSTQHESGMIYDIVSLFGYDNYYRELGLTNPVTDNQTEYGNIIRSTDIDKLVSDDTGKIDVVDNFYAITDKLASRTPASEMDSSKAKGNGDYITGLQELYTAKEDYKYPIISNVDSGDLTVDATGTYGADTAKKMFDGESNDYFVEFVGGKMAFVTHDADYKLLSYSGLQDIREVSTDYLDGDGNYEVLSEEKRDCKDAPVVDVTTEGGSDKLLFLPDCTYELADGTDLVRVRLKSFTDLNAYKPFKEDQGDNRGILYFYDSKYASPADAYADGGTCYAVKDGNYDVLLPVGDYTVTALVELDGGNDDYDVTDVTIGSFTSDYRDVDIDDMDNGDTPMMEWANGKSGVAAVDLTYNVPMEDIDLRSYIGNTGKVGGIKSIELSENQPAPEVLVATSTTKTGSGLPKGITLEDGVLSGTPTEVGQTKARITITAGNGSQLELNVTFRVKKAVPNVEVSVPDKDYEAGDDLPDLILGKDTPSGSVSWVVDEVKKLTEGDNTLTWEYTPDDDNYDKVTGTLVINASPKQTTTTVTTATGGSESSVSGSGTETTVSTTDVTSSTVDSDSTATGTGTDQSSGNGSATTTSGSVTTAGTGNGSGTGTTGTSGSGNGSDTTTASSTDNSGAGSGTTTTATGTGVPKNTLYGDLNLDGKVNLTDAVMLNKAVIGTITLKGQAAINANTFSDDKIDSNDATALLQFLVRYIDTLPVTK